MGGLPALADSGAGKLPLAPVNSALADSGAGKLPLALVNSALTEHKGLFSKPVRAGGTLWTHGSRCVSSQAFAR